VTGLTADLEYTFAVRQSWNSDSVEIIHSSETAIVPEGYSATEDSSPLATTGIDVEGAERTGLYGGLMIVVASALFVVRRRVLSRR
ncbi:MAG: hypothetical protein RLZZ40_1150, partial [Actinomycetota bacterium]